MSPSHPGFCWDVAREGAGIQPGVVFGEAPVARSRFFLWKLPWKSWEENPTGSWNGSGGKSLGAHPIPWAIPAHPNPIPAAFPWSCRWNSGRKRALGVGNCSFPAHSRPFSRELLIPSPYPWIWRFPGSLCPLEDIPDPLEFPSFPTPKIPSLGPSPSPGIPWMSPEAGKALGKGLE